MDFGRPEPEGPLGSSRDSCVDCPTTPRTFPIVITNSDGQALFNADIKLSSNHVVTALSATTSTVSFSVDVVASLGVPTGALSQEYFPSPRTNLCPQCPSGIYHRKRTMMCPPKPTDPCSFF